MTCLFYLKWSDPSLVLGNDAGQITNHVIRSAIMEIGFVPDSDEFRYVGNVTPDLIRDAVQFL